MHLKLYGCRFFIYKAGWKPVSRRFRDGRGSHLRNMGLLATHSPIMGILVNAKEPMIFGNQYFHAMIV
jgi:hypothetical protein